MNIELSSSREWNAKGRTSCGGRSLTAVFILGLLTLHILWFLKGINSKQLRCVTSALRSPIYNEEIIQLPSSPQQDNDDKDLVHHTWREFDMHLAPNTTSPMKQLWSAHVEKPIRVWVSRVDLDQKKIGEINHKSYPVFLKDSPLGQRGSDVCPYTTVDNPRESRAGIPIASLPGYTGWNRPHAPLLYWYRPLHFGPRPSPGILDTTTVAAASHEYLIPTSSDGRIQYIHDTTSHVAMRHDLSEESLLVPWTTVILCPLDACQGRSGHPKVNSQFYARAYGPAILAGRISRVPVRYYHVDSTNTTTDPQRNSTMSQLVGYEVSFYFRYPGVYTVEVVLEQGDAWALSEYPRGSSQIQGETDPAYEGWMLPGFPRLVEVVLREKEDLDPEVGNDKAGITKRPMCTMNQLEESHPGDQWVVHGGGRSSSVSEEGSFQRYQLGYATLGLCTDFSKATCSLLPTSSILWSPQSKAENSEGNLVARCMRHHATKKNSTSAKKLNIILIGDSVVRYNTNRLSELLKIDDDPGQEVYITFLAEIHTGILYALSLLQERMMELATRDEHRVVIFNFGLHDIKEGCVDYAIESMYGSDIKRTVGDCVDFYRTGFDRFLEFLETYPADLIIFRTTNAGWMRWGQFGFGWPATNGQQAVFSHHSARILNEVAVKAIQERKNNSTSTLDVKILDYYWPTLARPDNTDVDSADKQSIGSHLVHPGIDAARLLVRLEVMMILRHFCSDVLDDWV